MPSAIARLQAATCFRVRGLPASEDWTSGPLPLRRPDGEPVDASLRATYFRPRACAVLYGDAAAPTRLHRWLQAEQAAGPALAAELVAVPAWAATGDGEWLALVHWELPPAEAITELGRLVRVADPARQETLQQLLGGTLRLDPVWRRAVSVTLAELAPGAEPPPDTPAGWDAETAWLWAAASATPFSSFTPDLRDPELLSGRLHLSASWTALALRDGAAFVATPRSEADEAFMESARVYVGTIYTDVLLLGVLQWTALQRFADELSHIGNRFDRAAELRTLVNAVTEFRNVLWWDDVTEHGHANQLLQKIQHARRTQQLFDRVVADLDSFREQVEAQAAERLLEAERREERRSRQFDKFAAVAGIAFGLPLLVLTALLLPIRGVTEGHVYRWWSVLLLVVGSAVVGAAIGMLVNRRPFLHHEQQGSGG